jgi:hypothetical protein
MPTDVAKYQFQSWARIGISAHIKELDTLGNPAATLPSNERASVPIGVSINAAPQPAKDFALIGPGDIIGINRDMVVRTEPRKLDHQRRTELPGVYRVLRPRLLLALHPRQT